MWSRLFDRLTDLNRNILNIFFFNYRWIFYSKNVWVIGCSMAAFGIAIAGVNFMEPLGHEDCSVEKSAAYMSIHMALTGSGPGPLYRLLDPGQLRPAVALTADFSSY